MDYTKNLKLSKPSYQDDVDIQIINSNMDMLDDNISNLDYVKNVTTDDKGLTFTKKDNSQIDVPLNYLKLTGGNVTGDITVNEKPVISVTDSWYSEDNSSWWIKYSDGRLEQHIYVPYPTGKEGRIMTTVTLLTPFIDDNYFTATVNEVYGTRNPLSNTGISNSIAGKENTNTDVGVKAKTNTTMCIMLDAMSNGRVLCIGRWK